VKAVGNGQYHGFHQHRPTYQVIDCFEIENLRAVFKSRATPVAGILTAAGLVLWRHCSPPTSGDGMDCCGRAPHRTSPFWAKLKAHRQCNTDRSTPGCRRRRAFRMRDPLLCRDVVAENRIHQNRITTITVVTSKVDLYVANRSCRAR